MNKLNLLSFIIGFTMGGVSTWLIVKDKYEKKAQEDIDSVKAKFSYKKETTEDDKENEDSINKVPIIKDSINKYKSILNDYGYKFDEKTSKKTLEERIESKPYVISPDDFGEIDDYDEIPLIYYADNVLAYDNDEVVEDIDAVVGFKSLTTFGEYDDDSVYVRDDRLKVDYEILRSEKKYIEVLKAKPYLVEG